MNTLYLREIFSELNINEYMHFQVQVSSESKVSCLQSKNYIAPFNMAHTLCSLPHIFLIYKFSKGLCLAPAKF